MGYMFRIEFDGQAIGPYEASEAWDKMNQIFSTGIDVVLVNDENGTRVCASHPKEG